MPYALHLRKPLRFGACSRAAVASSLASVQLLAATVTERGKPGIGQPVRGFNTWPYRTPFFKRNRCEIPARGHGAGLELEQLRGAPLRVRSFYSDLPCSTRKRSTGPQVPTEVDRN